MKNGQNIDINNQNVELLKSQKRDNFPMATTNFYLQEYRDISKRKIGHN